MPESSESTINNDATATPLADGPGGNGNGNGDGTVADADRRWITFTLPGAVGADFASVVGDFNGWDPAFGAMIRDETDGSFRCSLQIDGGRRYQYRFLLDGARWVNDWTAGAYSPNEFGGEDSVLDLRESAAE